MDNKEMLQGEKILVVDDEQDVLESIQEILHMCDVTPAANFEEAKDLLESTYFDIAILDIMGMDGYSLLEIAKKRGVMAVMLTAHALSVEDTKQSHEKGAAYYVPKEKLANISDYLIDILMAKEKGKSSWWRWLERFGSFYAKKFGEDWRESDEDFWSRFPY